MIGGASTKTLIGAFGAIREIEIVSSCPGVTIPSETTRAFRKMNLSFFFEEVWAAVGPAIPDVTGISAQARAAVATVSTRLPLPKNTG